MMINRWDSLDGLRAVAVSIVLLAHSGADYPRSGGVGVDIFFVLSGFLITSVLCNEYWRRECINVKIFYIKRALRLLPCLVVTCMLVIVIELLINDSINVSKYLIALSYTANWVRAFTEIDLGVLGHTWSLAIEEQYYLLWPFCIIVLERLNISRISKSALLFTLACIVAVNRAAMVGGLSPERIHFGLDTHMDGLIMGSSLSYAVFHFELNKISAEGCLKFLSFIIVPFSIAGLLLLMYLITWQNSLMGKIGYFLVAGAAAVLILDLTLSRYSLIKSFLELKFMMAMGKISYGLYLLHFPIYDLLDRIYIFEYWVVGYGVKFIVALFVSVASYHYVEAPFLKKKSSYDAPS